MHILLFITAVALVSGYTLAKKRPDYLKPCSLKDKNFEKCAVENANAAFPHILNGDRKYGVPSLQPLLVPEVTVDAGNDFRLVLTNLVVTGLESLNVHSLKVDTSKNVIIIKYDVKNVNIISDYEVSGKISVLPVEGKGKSNVTAVGGVYTYSYIYKLTEKDGKKFAYPSDDTISYEMERAYFDFQNLFNGNEQLGNQINTFINENWKDVLDELGGALTQTIAAVARTIFSGYFKLVPFSTLILDAEA